MENGKLFQIASDHVVWVSEIEKGAWENVFI